ncbi:MAG: glycosyltransferase, partial [Candidatus Krumholzibacteriia bacterium]
VLPSRAEGMPLVVLEAMALGVPTLATAVAGPPEVIEDGTSGLLVPPDDVRALTAALERLADSPELRSRLGGAGARRTATHFSLEVMMRGFDACLTRAAAQRVP